MSDNHILTPKVDLIMAMDDLRLNGCNHSADLLKKAIFTTPVSVEPVNWPAVEARISEFVNEYEMVGEDEQGRDGHYTPNESERALILDAMHGVLADDELMALLRPAARVAAQPDLTQQTLDDVMAGIPARDAEIAALRKETEALQSQHATTLANIEAFVACDASAISYLSLGEYRTALLKMLRQAPAITSEKE